MGSPYCSPAGQGDDGGMLVQETGEGMRGVVGFHGWSGDHRTFAPLWGRMPAGWKFFSFDLPGCGRSASPREWNFRAMAREVAAEVVQLGQRDLVLVGSCSGAILTVSGGTVNLGSADRISNSVTVEVSSGTLGLGTNNDTVSTFTLSGTGTLGGTGTLTASSYALQGGTVNAVLGAGAITVSSGTTSLGSASRLNSTSIS